MPYRDKEAKLQHDRAYSKRATVKLSRKIRRAHPNAKLKARAAQMRWQYGITRSEFMVLFIAQGKCCAICKTSSNGPRDWHIDHDHVSGFVRGILCRHCNPMLGKAKDDPDILRRAATYLDDAISREYADAD